VFVAPTILGQWEFVRRGRGRDERLGEAADVPKAVRRAEAWVEKERKDSLGLVLLNTRWRHEPASERQKKLLEGRKIDVPKGITKGQASHLIAMLGRGR
jgi:hypothetical protein